MVPEVLKEDPIMLPDNATGKPPLLPEIVTELFAPCVIVTTVWLPFNKVPEKLPEIGATGTPTRVVEKFPALFPTAIPHVGFAGYWTVAPQESYDGSC